MRSSGARDRRYLHRVALAVRTQRGRTGGGSAGHERSALETAKILVEILAIVVAGVWTILVFGFSRIDLSNQRAEVNSIAIALEPKVVQVGGAFVLNLKSHLENKSRRKVRPLFVGWRVKGLQPNGAATFIAGANSASVDSLKAGESTEDSVTVDVGESVEVVEVRSLVYWDRESDDEAPCVVNRNHLGICPGDGCPQTDSALRNVVDSLRGPIPVCRADVSDAACRKDPIKCDCADPPGVCPYQETVEVVELAKTTNKEKGDESKDGRHVGGYGHRVGDVVVSKGGWGEDWTE